VQIDGAGDAAQFLQEIIGELAVVRSVEPDDLDIDRRGQTEIQYLAHHVGGRKANGGGRVRNGQPGAKRADVGRGGFVMPRQVDVDVGIAGPTGAEVLYAKLMPLYGRPMLSTTLTTPEAGITSRIVASTRVAERGRFLDACAGAGLMCSLI